MSMLRKNLQAAPGGIQGSSSVSSKPAMSVLPPRARITTICSAAASKDESVSKFLSQVVMTGTLMLSAGSAKAEDVSAAVGTVPVEQSSKKPMSLRELYNSGAATQTGKTEVARPPVLKKLKIPPPAVMAADQSIDYVAVVLAGASASSIAAVTSMMMAEKARAKEMKMEKRLKYSKMYLTPTAMRLDEAKNKTVDPLADSTMMTIVGVGVLACMLSYYGQRLSLTSPPENVDTRRAANMPPPPRDYVLMPVLVSPVEKQVEAEPAAQPATPSAPTSFATEAPTPVVAAPAAPIVSAPVQPTRVAPKAAEPAAPVAAPAAVAPAAVPAASPALAASTKLQLDVPVTLTPSPTLKANKSLLERYNSMKTEAEAEQSIRDRVLQEQKMAELPERQPVEEKDQSEVYRIFLESKQAKAELQQIEKMYVEATAAPMANENGIRMNVQTTKAAKTEVAPRASGDGSLAASLKAFADVAEPEAPVAAPVQLPSSLLSAPSPAIEDTPIATPSLFQASKEPAPSISALEKAEAVQQQLDQALQKVQQQVQQLNLLQRRADQQQVAYDFVITPTLIQALTPLGVTAGSIIGLLALEVLFEVTASAPSRGPGVGGGRARATPVAVSGSNWNAAEAFSFQPQPELTPAAVDMWSSVDSLLDYESGTLTPEGVDSLLSKLESHLDDTSKLLERIDTASEPTGQRARSPSPSRTRRDDKSPGLSYAWARV